MRIRWYGQSAFLLNGAKAVAIDPFGDIEERMTSRAPGRIWRYAPIEGLRADLVLVTHEHFDHDAVEIVEGSPDVIRSTAGVFDSPVGPVTAVAAEHDEVAGTKRGPNTIFSFALDGLRVSHFGDFGQHELRPEQQEALGTVDILLVPIGGGATIDGEVAARITRALRPRLVVPMHYRSEAVNFFEPPDAFLAALDTRVERLPSSDFEADELLGTRDRPTVALPAAPMVDA
jgi:L-ascorbate metabolism protein UlaG (beta-lactamase superfamily)